jgi:hypothetical protein
MDVIGGAPYAPYFTGSSRRSSRWDFVFLRLFSFQSNKTLAQFHALSHCRLGYLSEMSCSKVSTYIGVSVLDA